MKKVLLTFGLLAFLAVGVTAQVANTPKKEVKVDNPNAPVMTFESEVVDYGTIEQNADGIRFFVFTNTGKEPLIISNCKGSCGCTVPTWPKEPIKPGEKSKIQVKYATNRIGAINKSVTITSNAKEPVKVVRIKGTVLAPKTSPEKETTGAPVKN